MVLDSLFKTLKAGAKTAFGDKSFSENLQEENEAEIASRHLLLESKKKKFDDKEEIIEIFMRGKLPDLTIPNAYWGIKVFDGTEKYHDDSQPLEPVMSIFDVFKEPLTNAFDFKSKSFPLSPGLIYPEWWPVCGIFPSFIIPPMSGTRKLRFLVYLGDADNPVQFYNGYLQKEGPAWHWGKFLTHEEYFEHPGYIETADDADESVSLAIKLGVAVAMADGNLDDSEGNTIKDFIVQDISSFEGERKKKLKDRFNKAFKDSYNKALSGSLKVDNIIKSMNEIASKTIKYNAIELCYKVMSSDGVADDKELKILDKISQGLKLDKNIIKKIKDKNILKLDPISSASSDMDGVLGIKPDWNKEKIKTHLNKEFKKWNSRYQNLSEGKERENAQFMLDCIAEARKKYDK